MKPTFFSSIGWLIALLILCSTAQAQIYRWQDEYGRWQFSDTPPPHLRDQMKSKVETTPTNADPISSTVQARDLRAQLAKKYGTLTGLNQTTQAVVAVETTAGSGSGFFITDRGHLITNHHVIRPARFEGWQRQTEQLENAQRQMQVNKTSYEEELATLKSMEQELNQLRQEVNRENRQNIKRELEQRLQRNQLVYQQRKTQYDAQWQRFSTQLKEVETQLADLRWRTSLSNMASTFKIYLKDDTVLQARLISISEKHDLALLQLEGYVTPTLKLEAKSTRQGDKVHAIGSPLGMRDSVTAGIITRLSKDSLFTDAQILPGNSGGPLVNEQGEVIGVNTQKFSQRGAMGAGFGIAIPARIVVEEFQHWLTE